MSLILPANPAIGDKTSNSLGEFIFDGIGWIPVPEEGSLWERKYNGETPLSEIETVSTDKVFIKDDLNVTGNLYLNKTTNTTIKLKDSQGGTDGKNLYILGSNSKDGADSYNGGAIQIKGGDAGSYGGHGGTVHILGGHGGQYNGNGGHLILSGGHTVTSEAGGNVYITGGVNDLGNISDVIMSYEGGSVLIGTDVNDGYKLQVNGNTFSDNYHSFTFETIPLIPQSGSTRGTDGGIAIGIDYFSIFTDTDLGGITISDTYGGVGDRFRDDLKMANFNPEDITLFKDTRIGTYANNANLNINGKLLLEGFEIPNNIYSDKINGDLHIGYEANNIQYDGIKLKRDDKKIQIGSSARLFDLEVKGNISLNRGTDTSVKISLIDDDSEQAYISQDFDVNVNDSRLKIYSQSGIKIGDTGKSLQLNQFTIPTSDGTSGYVLATNGAGQLSFIAPPTGTAANAAGNAKEIQFRGASNGEFAASADLTWDNGTAKLLTTRNINASCLNLPNTNTVNINTVHSGIIYKEGNRFIHDFSYGLNDNGITPDGNNLFIGENAGNITTLGKESTLTNQSSYNIGIGKWSLYDLTLGQSNIAIGFNSSSNITSGVDNIAIGTNTLLNNIEGDYNIAIGLSALYSNKGNDNIGIGSNALLGNDNGDKNIAIGVVSLGEKNTGDNNIAIGCYSGKYIGCNIDVYDTFGNNLINGHKYKISYSGTTSFTSIGSSSNSVGTVFTYNGNAVSGTGRVFPVAENNIFIGNNSGGTGKDISDCIIIGTNAETYYDGVHNAIIIGQSTYDSGSNTVSIGNSAITDNYFNGNMNITGMYLCNLHSSAPTGVEGAIYYNSTTKKHYGHNGTNWYALY